MNEEDHGGVRWVGVSRGLYLVGIGTFLLLTTQDLLPPSFWSEAIAYWPVLLVAIGIRLLFERSSAPWLVLLGPLLVLGTLMYVAMRGPGRAEAESGWVSLRADRLPGLSAWTLEGRLTLASLDVASRRLPRGLLVEGRATDAGRHSVRVVEEAETGVVRVSNSWSGRTLFVLPGLRRARSELAVTTALPLTFDLELTCTTMQIDVAAAAVSRLAFDGALNNVTLRLGQPSSDVRLDLDGSFNQVVLEVPAGTPVKVSREGLLNLVDERQRDRAQAARPGYSLRLDGAFNRIVVRSAGK